MKWMTDITWETPWAFTGFIALAVLIFLWYRLRKNTKRVAVPGPVEQAHYTSPRTRLLPFLPFLLILSLILGIIALANPQKTNVLQNITTDGIDIFLVMDLSYSMLEEDFTPSRIAVAKEAALNFIEKRKNDRIGLVPFGTTAYTQCPLTMDHRVVKNLLDDMKVSMVGPNTAIGMGLATAVNRLKDSKAKSKVIVLFTDGINNVYEVDPITAAHLAAQFDIKVYTIGMTKVSHAHTGITGPSQEHLGVHEESLQEIARLTGGKYFRATSREGLERIYHDIDRLEKTEMEVTLIERADLKYHYLLLPAVILLLFWFLVSRTILKTFIP